MPAKRKKNLKRPLKKVSARKNKTRGTLKSTILNKRRKGFGARIIPWVKRFGFYVAIIVFAAWVGAWIWLSGSISNAASWVQNRSIAQSAHFGFTVQNILLEGRVNSDPNAVLDALNITKGDALFAFKPAAARASIENMPWIRAVHIERRLPDTLYIKLEERLPVALTNKNDTLRIVDDRGAVISDKNILPFKHLVIIHGKNADAHTPSFITTLRGVPVLYEKTKSATWVGQRRWDLHLYNGTTIHLPEHDFGFALTRLNDAPDRDDLLARSLKSIDLREPERIVIRPILGEVFERSGSNQEADAPAI